jgi:hypothetical protein
LPVHFFRIAQSAGLMQRQSPRKCRAAVVALGTCRAEKKSRAFWSMIVVSMTPAPLVSTRDNCLTVFRD